MGRIVQDGHSSPSSKHDNTVSLDCPLAQKIDASIENTVDAVLGPEPAGLGARTSGGYVRPAHQALHNIRSTL